MATINDRKYNYKSPWITRFQDDDLLQCSVDAWDNLYNLTAVLTLPMEQLLKWLQRNNLIASEMCCGNADCNLPCKMNARSRSLDGYTWRCPRRHETSIRKYSFFSQSHLHLADIIMFIYRYAEGNSLLSGKSQWWNGLSINIYRLVKFLPRPLSGVLCPRSCPCEIHWNSGNR